MLLFLHNQLFFLLYSDIYYLSLNTAISTYVFYKDLKILTKSDCDIYVFAGFMVSFF